MTGALVKLNLHHVRRLIESARAREVSEDDVTWVRSVLKEGEFDLWQSMQGMDRCHSIGVSRRLIARYPASKRHEIAAALLHDVGKAESQLSIWSRVVATLVGPRSSKFESYLDHERIGANMCRRAGIEERVCQLIQGLGPVDERRRLQEADDL